MKKLIVGLLLLFALETIHAQNGRWNIGLGGGISIPVGSATDMAKTGFDGFFNYSYNLTPNIALGLEYNYAYFSGKSFLGGAATVDHSQVNSLSLKAFYLFGKSQIKPYAAASTGYYWNNFKETVTFATGSASGNGSLSCWGYALELGARVGGFNVGGSFNASATDFHYFLVNVGYVFNF